MIKVLGIKVTDRIKEIGMTQKILSRHAAVITTRFGFHELTNEICSREAYIILHLNGDPADAEKLIDELNETSGLEIRDMTFDGNKQVPEDSLGNENLRILGILVEREKDSVSAVQKLLTSYGCIIRARLGVNEMFFGEPAGLIILELFGDNKQMVSLEEELKALDKVHVRKMVFG